MVSFFVILCLGKSEMGVIIMNDTKEVAKILETLDENSIVLEALETLKTV